MQDGRYGVRVRLRMGYHSTNLDKSCVTPLYQIMFTRGIDCLGQFGDYRSIYGSNVEFKVIFGQEI